MAIHNYLTRIKGKKQPLKPSISGAQAEQLAAKYLCEQQLNVVKCNYRCRRGEIDLIMREGNTLVFVEVRYRQSNRHGSPEETVDWRKQKKLLMAAEFFLQKHRQYQSSACRFDVIAAYINHNTGKLAFNWVKNAFGY